MKHKEEPVTVGRNDPCPCGSGKKYKKCCMSRETPPPTSLARAYREKYGICIKQAEDIRAIARTGRLALELLDRVEQRLRPGITTDQVNTLVHDHTVAAGAVPAPLNYRGFPKSVCVSVNDEVCHGIPGSRILRAGDIVNVDVTPILNGYYADVNKTFFVGTPGPDAVKIVDVTRRSLAEALTMVAPGNHVGDIGWAIQRYVEAWGCSVVREFVGHGVGFDFHEPPHVPHYGRRGEGVVLVPGMVFTIEPMINFGARGIRVLPDGWTAVTADGSLSAQFEQTLVVTSDGFESLTPFDL